MDRGARGAPARSLKARAIQLLAQREHSRLELKRKLLPHAVAEDAHAGEASDEIDANASAGELATRAAERVDALLDWLADNQYLSEQRFAESRVHARASRFGNLRIRQELAQHGVGLSAIAESSLKDTELARARAVWARKFSSPPANPAEHAKQARFLAGRGFPGDLIRQVLRQPSRAGSDDEPTPARSG